MTEPRSLEELQARRKLCLICLQAVSEVDPSDPRRESALVEYNRQLASIDAQITAIVGRPPDTVVGLKSARLFPKAGDAQ